MKNIITLIAFLLIYFVTDAQTNLIQTTGPIGVGTTSPGAQLESRSDANALQNLLILKNRYSTPGIAGSRLGFSTYRDVDANNLGASIDAISTAGIRNGNLAHGAKLIFNTSKDGADGVEPRMTILSTGEVGIGTLTPVFKLHVIGMANISSTTTLGTSTIGYGHDYTNNIPGSYGLFYSDRGDSWTEVAVHNQGRGVMLYSNPQAALYPGMWGTTYPGLTAGIISNPTTPLVLGSGTESMRIGTNGYLGIGTALPPAKLTVSGTSLNSIVGQTNISAYTSNSIRMISSSGTNSQDGIMYQSGSNGGGAGIAFGRGGSWDTFMSFYTNYNQNGGTGNIIERMRLDENGNLGIGTTDTKGYKLGVNGTAIFTKAVVKNYNNWPDFVFLQNYELPSLSSLETYINENKHLPDVASAEEVEKDGIDLGSTQAALLRKIEELTLYVIEQDKKQKIQQKLIDDLINQVTTLCKKNLN